MLLGGPPPVLQREQLLTVALQGPSTNNDSQSSQEFGNSRDHSDVSSVRVWEHIIPKYSKYQNTRNTKILEIHKLPKCTTMQYQNTKILEIRKLPNYTTMQYQNTSNTKDIML